MSQENNNPNSEQSSDGIFSSAPDNGEETAPRSPRRVTLTACICACVAFTLAAVMLTYTVANNVFKAKLAAVKLEQTDTTQGVVEDGLSYDLRMLQSIFKNYSFEDLNDDELRTAVLKAYVYATGDRYAEYYTDEEYAALTADMGGDTQGIGINIINSSVVTTANSELRSLKVINVTKDSPAYKAFDKTGEKKLLVGDHIIAVGSIEENTTVSYLGYDMALSELKGEKGTSADFVVYRESTQEFIEFSIIRDEFKASSVMYRKAENDESIGVVKIIEFDRTTPNQLTDAVDSLLADGCDKFVFDVRNNPGGELSSIVAVLSYFLEEGDTIISVKNNAGDGSTTTVAPVESSTGCSVSAEDIGKYKDLNMTVLCNGSTASAAELFVANFRDHGLGEIIGTKTYGKGSMQSYINLSSMGIDGVLKITAHMYYPPDGESYDGIGIEPTETVEMSDEAKNINIYDLYGTNKDNQFMKAVEYLNK